MQVLVRDNNVDQALKALKKKMQREGVFREMKLRRHYEKPSERRAREAAEAVRRARKMERKRLEREAIDEAAYRRYLASAVADVVGRQAAAARGEAYDEAADAAMRAAVEEQIEAESKPFFLSGRIYDDGVIDPRDTRTVLGLCLSAIESTQPGPAWSATGATGFGVFRP